MLKLAPYITIDTATQTPHLTITVVDSTEQQGEPKIGEVYMFKGVWAHTPVRSATAAIARYCGYVTSIPELPPVAAVEARLRREFEQGQQRGGAIAA